MARDRFDDDENRDDRYDDDRDSRDDRRNDRRNDRRPEDVLRAAKDKVKAPAILMLIAGIITVLMLAYNIVDATGTDQLAEFQKERQVAENDPKLDENGKKMIKQIYDVAEQLMVFVIPLQPAMWVISGLVALITIVGSIRLMKLSGSGWPRAAAILNMITCFVGCCLIGLPVGIWVLIVLGNPDVKAAMNPRPSVEV